VLAVRSAGSVVMAASLEVARPLVQMRTDVIEPVVASQSALRIEYLQLFQANGRTVHHRDSDRLVQQHHRAVGHPLEHAIRSAASRCPRYSVPHRRRDGSL
jgi:hypothetical protein